MDEFLRKFENRSIKITQVITKSINLQLFTIIWYCVGVRCDEFVENSMVQYTRRWGASSLHEGIVYHIPRVK